MSVDIRLCISIQHPKSSLLTSIGLEDDLVVFIAVV